MAVEYSEQFLSRIQADGTSRADALKGVRLVDTYMARKDLSTKKKAAIVDTINSLGGQELTLGDLVTEDANRVIFIENIIAEGKTSAIDQMVGDFRNVLADIGVTRQGTTNPFREAVKGQVGEARYIAAGFDTTTARLRPISIPPEVYQETKDIAASLMNNDDPTRKAAGARMLLMMLGGYRPSDFKAFSIENIDFETGIVSGLELKTDKGTKGIGIAYMPRPQLDVIRTLIGNRTSGLVFEKPETLDKIIREELKTSNLPKIRYLQESTKQVVEQPFTAYDFRRMQESTLQAAGFNSDNPIRKYLTWRPLSKKEASEGYMAVQNQSSAIEAANALSFEPYVHLTEGNTVSLNDNTVMKTHGQFLADVGVKNLSPFTKKYVASQKGRSLLPVNVVEKMDAVDDGVTYPQESIMNKGTDISQEAADEYLKTSKVKGETRLVQAEIDLEEKKQKLVEKKKASPTPRMEMEEGSSLATFEGFLEEDPAMKDKLKKAGLLDKLLGKGAKILVGAVGLETARQIVTEPAAVARDMAIEGALLAAKAPAAVAAAASMAMEPKQTAIQTLTEEERKNPQFTQNRPEPLADAEQEAMRDTGFVNIDRRPEAVPINQNQGASFLDNGR
tara:strand:- start:27 stop:1883 length:1857 start_codon:yes stop_codon:yes gene_type:complete